MALNFPAKIYQILENESSDIIRWHPNGAAFRIVDHGRFEREIIPKYFRHNQLSSVQRQLNLYGFKCISRGEDKGAFFHPKFRRGDWEVVKRITRYAPLKKDGIAPLGEKKDLIITKSDSAVQQQESISLPDQAPSQPLLPADHNYSSAYNTYSAPITSYPPFDAFFHHPDLGGTNWHWGMMPHSHIFPHLLAMKGMDMENQMGGFEEKKEEMVESQPSDTASTSSEATVPQGKATPAPAPNHPRPVDSIKPMVRVENNVITIDPYFDLGDEFDLFHSEELTGDIPVGDPKAVAAKPAIVASPIVAPSTTDAVVLTAADKAVESSPIIAGKQTCEMGVNTEITMVQMNQIWGHWSFTV